MGKNLNQQGELGEGKARKTLGAKQQQQLLASAAPRPRSAWPASAPKSGFSCGEGQMALVE